MMSEKPKQVFTPDDVSHNEIHPAHHASRIVDHQNTEEVDAFIAQMERELEAWARRPSIFRPSIDPKYFTWVMVIFASMGGMLFGLDQSLISGANLHMPEDSGLSSQQQSLVNSFMPLGAIFGSLILGPANEYFGRRGALIISIFFYTVGAALEAGSINFKMMIAGRLILGLGIGIEVGTCPVYVAESVNRRVRGNLVSLYQFNIALGEVLGFVVAAIFIKLDGSWRYILGSSLVFSTIMFIGVLFLPESPRFKMHQGKSVEAFEIWKRIRGVEYMSILMTQIGFDSVRATYMSMVGGGSLFLGTIPAILFMEKFGRRFWANTMLPGFFIGLVIIAASYMIPLDQNPQTVEGLYITGLILYMGFYGPYACLTWVIPAEVYPTYLRSYGMMASDAAVNLGNFIITFTFTDMQNAMTKQGLTLGLFGGIAVLGFIYQVLFMPETKNMTLEEIDLVFSKPIWAGCT